MKYVLYDLDWQGYIGNQPYQIVKDNGAEFNGGIFKTDNRYFGYITGTDENCNSALTACSDIFNMVELSQEEAFALYQDFCSHQIPIEELNITNSGYMISEDGKFKPIT